MEDALSSNVARDPLQLCSLLNFSHGYTRWWFQISFIFTPILGDDSRFLLQYFSTGWFNHQLATDRW